MVSSRAAPIRDAIDAMPVLLGEDWVATLEERKQEEAAFHDSDREGHRDEQPDSTPNRRFYQAVAPVRNMLDSWIRRVAPGSVFLDYACGNGLMSFVAAESGADLVVGIDISATSVQNAAETAAARGLAGHTRFLQRDCEDTGLPAGIFSAALCSGMLHHLDLERGYAELHRLMAPGGRILCAEALSHNPFIQLYRNRTPQLRTDYEKRHILGVRDIKLARRWFRVENVRYWLMASPLATFLPAGPVRRAGIAAGHAIDAVLTRVPLLRLWSWQVSFELVKP